MPRRRFVLAVLALAALVALAIAGTALTGLAVGWAYEGRILPNVRIAGLDVAGVSADVARARVAAAVPLDAPVTLAAGDVRLDTTAAELGRSVAIDEAVTAAFAVGRSSDPVTALGDRLRAITGPTEIELTIAQDPESARARVDELAALVDRPGIDAMVVRLSDRWIAIEDHAGRRLDRPAATALVLARLHSPDPLGTTVELPLEPVPASLDAATATAAVDAAARMAAPLDLTLDDETSWPLDADALARAIHFVDGPGIVAPSLDVEAIRASLATIRPEVARKPVEAILLVTKSGSRFGFVGGRDGRSMHVEQTLAATLTTILARRDEPASAGDLDAVPIVTVVRQPKLTTEEAAALAPRMSRLSTWTTRFQSSERNGFGANITIPARLINGTVVAPGATFDFWGAVGPVTPARGFRMGGIIQGGRTNPTGAIGGGICSASTTLFNAAARAGLQIVERHAHYYYINRYPLGLDATVSKSGGRIVQNMRFRNDTPYPIFIRGTSGAGWVRFELYGVANGRRVTFSTPQVWNVSRAVDRSFRTSSLPAGVRRRVETPTNGMNVFVVRTVRNADGQVVHRDELSTRYNRVDGEVLIGTG